MFVYILWTIKVINTLLHENYKESSQFLETLIIHSAFLLLIWKGTQIQKIL